MAINPRLEGGVLILDEAQLSYWDDELWIQGLKPIGSSTPYMVILFASYGSASRNIRPVATPFRVQEEQLVGLARGRNPSVGLLLTEEEAEGVVKIKFVKIKFPDHRFDKSLLDYIYNLFIYYLLINPIIVLRCSIYVTRRCGCGDWVRAFAPTVTVLILLGLWPFVARALVCGYELGFSVATTQGRAIIAIDASSQPLIPR